MSIITSSTLRPIYSLKASWELLAAMSARWQGQPAMKTYSFFSKNLEAMELFFFNHSVYVVDTQTYTVFPGNLIPSAVEPSVPDVRHISTKWVFTVFNLLTSKILTHIGFIFSIPASLEPSAPTELSADGICNVSRYNLSNAMQRICL